MSLQYLLAKSHIKLIESNKELSSPSVLFGTYENPLNSYRKKNQSMSLSSSLHFFVILFIGIVMFIKRFKSPKSILAEKPTTTFNDVKGVDEYLSELKEIVNILKNYEKYQKIGAKVPKGILLVGEPGTGKTLLARAVAGEANVNFFSTSGAEFDEVYVGVGAKRIRELFDAAKQLSPSIIFIDEIDSIGQSRKNSYQNHHRQSLNQLLVEMDGFDTKDNVIVIAATNMPKSLDEALRRPGRFDKTIEIEIPYLKSRKEIIDLYLSKIKCDSSVNSEEIAKSTFGMTGADLANIINTAMQQALKNGRNFCNSEDIENAKDRILMGINSKSQDYLIDHKLSVSMYEAAKAVTIINTEGSIPLHKVSILKRGQTYGKTSQMPEKDMLSMNKMEALANIDIKIAGKVFFDLEFSENKQNSLCEKDITEVTNYVYKLVLQGLFDEHFGVIYFDQQKDLGQGFKDQVDQAAKKILQESYERVKKLLISKREDVKKISENLLEKETLTKAEVLEIINTR